MQQPSSSGSIAGLLNIGSLQRKYIGVLKSRSFAEQAEKRAHLKELYHLKRASEVIDKYTKCVKFDDNVNDGLIYITVTLDAPPLFVWNTADQRERVRQTAAAIARSYYKSLIDYLVNVDSDKELVLLRAADVELARARQNFDVSVHRLAKFVKSKRIKATSIPSVSSAGALVNGDSALVSSTSDAATAATNALALYGKKAQLEAQITAAETLHTRLQALLSSPFTEVAAIPGEDPLLVEARRSYSEARRTYETMKAQFGTDNPRLISAKTSMDIAEKKLRSQISAVLRGDTTENLNLEALRSTYATVLRQVADSERDFQKSRELTTDLGQLSAEVALNLKVLEAAMSSAETLKMTTVAGRNRANLVDDAVPEDKSHPGKGMMIALSFLVSAAAVGMWAAIEYTLDLNRSGE